MTYMPVFLFHEKKTNMKIFLVDDNPAFRNTLKDFIENKLGHTVIGQASSGEEFLFMAPSNYADIVLMDYLK